MKKMVSTEWTMMPIRAPRDRLEGKELLKVPPSVDEIIVQGWCRIDRRAWTTKKRMHDAGFVRTANLISDREERPGGCYITLRPDA